MSEAADQSRSNIRRRLIDETLLDLYAARAEALDARRQHGPDLPDDVLSAFQKAIIQLYYALRPLRNEAVVEEHWTECELSPKWVDVVDPDPDNEDATDGEPELEDDDEAGAGPRREPVRGLDAIADLGQTRTERRTTTTMRGEKTVEVVVEEVLPLEILIDISAALEDAAGKLGFNPEVPSEPQWSEINKELITRADEQKRELFKQAIEDAIDDDEDRAVDELMEAVNL